MSWRDEVRTLSDRIVAAQAPIRVLDAIKWDDRVRDRFFADGCREQPIVDRDYYLARPLNCDTAAVRDEFHGIEQAIASTLGTTSPVAQLMDRTCEQYRTTLDMIDARGSADFGRHSAQLYGLTADVFHLGGPSVEDLADRLRDALTWIEGISLDDIEDKSISGTDAVDILQANLDVSLGPGLVSVRLDDGIVADAAAGSNYIKLRADVWFSQRQLDQLEAHEGWVHVATSLNGLAQPYCTFLGKAPPPVTVTQEGLATLTEIVTMRSHPLRLMRIVNRIDGVRMASAGATFVEVFEHFRTAGLPEEECWQTTQRVYRGSTPTGPPFTKDIAYGKGLVLTYAYVRVAVMQKRLDRIPMLFCGKVDLASMGLMTHLFDEGLVVEPVHIPAAFADPYALVSDIAFSRFLRDLDFEQLESDYQRLI